jgi:hypothetical protein
MDRLVDVFGRFYIVLDKKNDFQRYQDSVNKHEVIFELKVVHENNHRAKVVGSMTDDKINIELVYGDKLVLHPEPKNQFFSSDVSIDTLITDPETITVEVSMFHAGKMQSGHTISRGKIALVTNHSLLYFLEQNAIRNLRCEAAQRRKKKANAAHTRVEVTVDSVDDTEAAQRRKKKANTAHTRVEVTVDPVDDTVIKEDSNDTPDAK